MDFETGAKTMIKKFSFEELPLQGAYLINPFFAKDNSCLLYTSIHLFKLER